MYCLLYDIPSQKTRSRLVRLCKDNGLKRIKKSCFWGTLSSPMLARMEAALQQLAKPDDQICLIPVAQAEAKQIKSWGKATDIPFETGNCVCFM